MFLNKMATEEGIAFLVAFYIIAILFGFCIYECNKSCIEENSSNISNPDESNLVSNDFQMDNIRQRTTSTNNDQQDYLVPLISVLNGLEYEINRGTNGLHRPLRQTYNVAQTSTINNSAPQAPTVPITSGLNDVVHYISAGTSFSRSPLEDPPPSYDECLEIYYQ